MKGFTSFLAEAKNTHMEHIEDNILNGGVNGARESLNFLRAIRDMLAGNSKSSVNISCLLYTSPSPRDRTRSRMPSSA